MLPHSNKEVNINHGKIFGNDPVKNKQIGLGMDDANGICVALQLLKAIPNLKVCFTTEEEIGFNGAEIAAENIDFFCDVSYFIQADRHGKSDLITYTNCLYVTSEKWLELATPIMAKYGYSEHYGLGTDIGVLAEKLQLSAVNVSCGYYNEHTNNEYTVISELQNCLNFIESLINTIPCDIQYEIKVDYHAYNSNFSFGNTSYYKEYPEDIYDDTPCSYCKDFDCMHCPYDNWWNDEKWKAKSLH